MNPETPQHFIGECAEFKAERDSYKEKLTKSQILSRELILQLENPEILTQLTLDASVIIDTTKLTFEKLGSLELYTREYIYRIHMRRLVVVVVSLSSHASFFVAHVDDVTIGGTYRELNILVNYITCAETYLRKGFMLFTLKKSF